MERIKGYANCDDSVFIVALIYIDRLIESRKFVISSLNIHRLLITCVMVAVKFFEDEFFKNSFYAKLGGIPGWEINCLEIELLRLLNFNLFIDSSLYHKYFTELSVNLQMIVPPTQSLHLQIGSAVPTVIHNPYSVVAVMPFQYTNMNVAGAAVIDQQTVSYPYPGHHNASMVSMSQQLHPHHQPQLNYQQQQHYPRVMASGGIIASSSQPFDSNVHISGNSFNNTADNVNYNSGYSRYSNVIPNKPPSATSAWFYATAIHAYH